MNAIWFVLDTLRADHLGCCGCFRSTSPNIDRLAREGMLFEGSYASAIATGPGFTSLFTGLAAINHGFYVTPWDEPNAPLLDDQILLQNDPLERHNRAVEEREVVIDLEGKLRDWVGHHLSGKRTDPMPAGDGAWTCYIGERGDR